MNQEKTDMYLVTAVLGIIEKLAETNTTVNLDRLPCSEYAYLELSELKVLIAATIENGQLNKALDMLNLLSLQTLGKSLAELDEVKHG